MLVLWAPEEEVRRRVLEVLDGVGEEIRIAASWQEFRAELSGADCGVVAEPEPRPELFGQLQALEGRRATLVLTLRRNPRVLRRLKDVIVQEVVWLDELSELPAAVRGARTERRLRDVEHDVRACDHLPGTLVDALSRSLRSRPPLTSVQELASDLERDRRTLWHHWRNAVDEEESRLTLKGFLDWVVLLRAAALKTGRRSWHDVAEDLGVHARTLRRMAKRRMGVSLRDLAPPPVRGDETFEAFRQEALAPLLEAAPRGRSGGNGRTP